MSALRVYVAGAWVEQHTRARPMIARLREAGCVITCDWTVAEGDVCACEHHRQKHAPYAKIRPDVHNPVGSSWRAEGSTRCEECGCPAFNGIGVGGDSALTVGARRKYALDDLDGVLSADVVLLLAANDKGACGSWVELGAALAARELLPQKTSAPPICRPYVIVAGPKNKRTIFTELADALVDSDEEGYRTVISRQTIKAGGLVLPGWSCPSCGGFNGEAKEILEKCRACGTSRPGLVMGVR